jgi:hypothetical protein
MEKFSPKTLVVDVNIFAKYNEIDSEFDMISVVLYISRRYAYDALEVD